MDVFDAAVVAVQEARERLLLENASYWNRQAVNLTAKLHTGEVCVSMFGQNQFYAFLILF